MHSHLFFRHRMAALALFGTVALSGCKTTEAFPPDQVPESIQVNILELRDSYLAEHPEAEGLRLMKNPNWGFVFHLGDSVDFVHTNLRGRVIINTRISSVNGNDICVDDVIPSSWSGACITLVRNFDDTFTLNYEFGNGYGSRYKVRNLQAQDST